MKTATMRSIQNEMVQSKKELATRDLSIQRARDELNLAHMRTTQESERVNVLKKIFQSRANVQYSPKDYCFCDRMGVGHIENIFL